MLEEELCYLKLALALQIYAVPDKPGTDPGSCGAKDNFRVADSEPHSRRPLNCSGCQLDMEPL